MSFELGKAFVRVEPEVSDGAVSSMGSKLVGGLAALGIGAAISSQISDNLSITAGLDKVEASLGLTAGEAERLGKMAGQTYSGAWGESLGDVQTMYGETFRAFPGLSDSALQQVTEGAATTADVFDQDFNEVVRAAQQLMTNGLAPDAQSAMAIVATSLRDTKGPADEVIESIGEYSTFFAQAGLTGENVLGSLTSKWATNRFAIDKVGDAVKEYGIRVIDGSDTTSEALESMGFDVREVEAAYAEGGPAAEAMTQKVIGAINSTSDPIERSRVGVALMGTSYEDLGANATPILGDLIEGQTGYNDTIDQMDASAYDNAATKLESMKRRGITAFQGLVGSLLGAVFPALETMGGVVSRNTGVVKVLAGVITAVFLPGLITLGIQALVSGAKQAAGWVLAGAKASWAAVKTVASVALQGAKWAWLGAKALAQGARVAAGWLLAMGPIALVIAAVVGVVILIVRNFDTIKSVVVGAWNWVKGKTSAFVSSFRSAISNGFNAVRTKVSSVVSSVKSSVSNAFNAVRTKVSSVVSSVRTSVSNAFNAVRSAISNAVNTARSKVSSAFSSIRSAVSSAATTVKTKIRSAFTAVVTAVRNKLDAAVSLVRSLPGRALSALGKIGAKLKGAGRKLIQGFVNGITDKISAVGDAVGNVVQTARDLFPFSPAKEGPFSGKGYTLYSGQALAGDLAKGITKNKGKVKSAVSSLMGEAQGGLNANLAVAGAGARGGDTYYTIERVELRAEDLREVRDMREFFDKLQTTARAGRLRQ